VIAFGIAAMSQASSAAPAQGKQVRIAILSDCKGAFAFGYELDIGGANAAFSKFAGAKPKNRNKPSAGLTGGSAGGARLVFTDYGCGDDTPATILKEIRRVVVQQDADVVLGPLSGDEAVATANWAKTHPAITVIIGTAASQDPTMQIAPKNVFRYFGDGAQWNAGIGEILYKRWGWRNAAVIMDDYSFAWTSAAGFIADFCAAGGRITKRVFPPLNTTDYSSYVRQLPSPDDVDGYFWVVGGTGTDPAFKAFEQAHGTLKARQHSGNLFLWFLTGAAVAPKLRGAYIGGFGIGPGLKYGPANQYRATMARYYNPKKVPIEDSFTLNYYRGAHALVVGLQRSGGRVGAALQKALPRSIKDPYQISDGGTLRLDSRRQAVQDQYLMQINSSGKFGISTAAYVPKVDQTFGGTFGPNKPAPSRAFPPCTKRKLPWQGKIKVVSNGKVTNQVVK
jgi:branched-chain amino acid transport system substrate-binding protein